ncbi:MAG TPA: polysaccharide biosynthesis/export family protein [Opitutaceae bacterium]|jgi:protein involved in polysaccharide export with SLBB domain/capsular polysaccharide biosynthesis protein|nr:polysaccharide biosynthesis/export family protein [Opitutaceae bacterium]
MNVTPRNQLASTPFDAWAVLEFWSRRWRWLAAWTLIMACVGAFAARSVWKKTFTSTSTLIHYEPSSIDDTYHPRDISTPSLVVMLQAPGLFEEVGSHLKPAMSAKQLSMRLSVNLDRNNDVVTVTAMSGTREEAIDIVNRFSFAAINYTQVMQKQEAIEAGENVKRQLAGVEQEITTTRNSVPAKDKAAVNALTSSAEAAQQPQSDLPQRIRLAREQLDDLLTRYTDAHPLVLAQRAELNALEDQQKANPAAAAPRPATEAVSPMIYGRVTPEEIAMGERLRSLETNRALLISRQRAIQPFREAPPGYFRVLLSADANPTPMRRYRLEIILFALLGGFLGLCGSAAHILLSEFLDNRIKTRADVRRVTGLPLLATLGDLRKMTPGNRDQWAFRAWTALQSKLSISPNHGMVVGITSANTSDGRTTWVNLLSSAASACGFRVLTITAQPSEEMNAELAKNEKVKARKDSAKEIPAGSDNTTSLTTSVLSTPGQIVDKLTSAECPPVVSIPLPGWVWNLERRRQWRAALEAWRAIDHVVIFVELPPASLAESVLLAENIPNLIWLCDSNKSDSEETLIELETLRDASCNLVGAVLNRERGTPVRGQFGRWLGSSALLLALGLGVCATPARAAVVAQPSASQEAQNAENPGQFSAAESHQRDPWQDKLTLGPGDVLTFHLYGSPELTREEVPVGPDGRISYLEAQNVLADGATVDELRDRLDTELSHYRRAPQVFVTPVAYHSKRYYVMGTVVKKGVFYLDRPTTVIEAVARAKGFETGVYDGDTIEATDFSRSFITRNGRRLPVNMEKLFLHGDLSQNVTLQPNDYVFFPPSASGEVYVLGFVGAPGPVPFNSDMSAISAITSRGGFAPGAWRTRVLVIRGSLDHPKAIRVDVDSALLGNAPNLALEPGDIVYVSNRPWLLGEELLDRAASAFVESAVVTWTGLNVGPDIISRPSSP